MATQIHKPYHTCIAIKIEGITAQIITCKANEAMHLASEDGRRQLDIAKGETFHLVASDSAAGYYYPVAFNAQLNTWRCYCPSAKPCKHERALKPYVVARYRSKVKASKPKPEQPARRLTRDEYCQEFGIYA